jgi:hypothetical protein
MNFIKLFDLELSCRFSIVYVQPPTRRETSARGTSIGSRMEKKLPQYILAAVRCHIYIYLDVRAYFIMLLAQLGNFVTRP